MSRKRMERFQRWMKRNGVEHSDGLEFQVGGKMVSGTGVRALCDLKKGELIAKIPKRSCLDVVTTGAAQALSDARLGGGLGVAVAVMHERSRGKNSPWFPYLKVLPWQEPVPFVWSEEEIDSFLAGTELHKVIEDDKRLMKEDWEENVAPLCEQDPEMFPAEHFTLECYLAARSLVSSRCFEIDERHGHGFVPLADLFNHKTAAEDVHFMTNDSDSEDESDKEAEASFEFKDEKTNEVLEMILVKDVTAGSEIFNTYGQLSNAALLHRYGFTEPGNPFDIVNLDMECVIKVLLKVFSKKHVKRRGEVWRKAGFCGCESQGCEYFEIDFTGKPQVELLLLLFLMHSSAEECARLKDTASEVRSDFTKAAQALGWREDRVLPAKKKKRKRQDPRDLSVLEQWLLTPPVIESLDAILMKRDEHYGNLLEEDQRRYKSVNSSQGPKEFHALSLRLAERKVLQKCRHAIQEL